MFGERGTAAGSFTMPKGVAVDGSGNVYVTDSRAHRFVVFSMQGDYLLSVGARSFVENGEVHPGGFGFPKGIAADLDGKILIVDSFNRMVHRYQYLDANYLEKNPIRPEEIYLPPDFK
jgi:sugar lactone lactonase YvrE